MIAKRQSRYCSVCGAKTNWIKRENDSKMIELCCKCGNVMFRNSKPCAGALVVNGDRLLLVKRGIQPFKGFWDIPGGFLDEGEHPRDGAIREVKEETNLTISIVEFLGIFMDNYCGEGGGATQNTYYIAEPLEGTLSPGDDAIEAKWFNLKNLPQQIAFPEHAKEVFSCLIEKLRREN